MTIRRELYTSVIADRTKPYQVFMRRQINIFGRKTVADHSHRRTNVCSSISCYKCSLLLECNWIPEFIGHLYITRTRRLDRLAKFIVTGWMAILTLTSQAWWSTSSCPQLSIATTNAWHELKNHIKSHSPRNRFLSTLLGSVALFWKYNCRCTSFTSWNKWTASDWKCWWWIPKPCVRF